MKTPWVLVAIHAPWYHTYKGHYKEVECMRQAYEPLLVAHQVDLVLSGHVHAYERTKPVMSYDVSGRTGVGGMDRSGSGSILAFLTAHHTRGFGDRGGTCADCILVVQTRVVANKPNKQYRHNGMAWHMGCALHPPCSVRGLALAWSTQKTPCLLQCL